MKYGMIAPLVHDCLVWLNTNIGPSLEDTWLYEKLIDPVKKRYIAYRHQH